MSKQKIAVTIDDKTIATLDRMVSDQVFPSRSRAIEDAVKEKLARIKKTRLARACAMLDPREERAMADIGLEEDLKSWPEY